MSFKPFEDGCPNCGYWQCNGCNEVGDWEPDYLMGEDDEQE